MIIFNNCKRAKSAFLLWYANKSTDEKRNYSKYLILIFLAADQITLEANSCKEKYVLNLLSIVFH